MDHKQMRVIYSGIVGILLILFILYSAFSPAVSFYMSDALILTCSSLILCIIMGIFAFKLGKLSRYLIAICSVIFLGLTVFYEMPLIKHYGFPQFLESLVVYLVLILPVFFLIRVKPKF